jgi:peptidoglycan L-alanyl-D-glutamate endopeptidase CwlK
MQISPTSERRLKGVHPDHVSVVRRTAKDWKDPETGFIITCGVRTIAEQRVLVAKGASRTMRSRHIPAANKFSHAVDFACTIKGVPKWDWPLYARLAKAVKAAAKAEKVPIEWGGDWASFRYGPHFQLPWKTHPGTN